MKRRLAHLRLGRWGWAYFPPTGSNPVQPRGPPYLIVGRPAFSLSRAHGLKNMTSKINILSSYGVLHAPDGSIIQRGVKIVEEHRTDGTFIVIDGNAYPATSVRCVTAPTRFFLPDDSYAMP